jgi:glycosidase
MEFHVSRQARERYQFDQALFASTGNVIFANFQAARLFAQKMNEQRDLQKFPSQAVRAGQLNAMGLIDELSHQVVEQYRLLRNPQALEKAEAWLQERLGSKELEQTLGQFASEFPPLLVFRGELPLEDYLQGQSQRQNGEPVANRLLVLEELIMLWLSNANPAFAPFQELFNDANLAKNSAYVKIMPALHDFFEAQPGFGPDEINLIDMLRAPALAHPDSLTAQLEFMRTRWSSVIGAYILRLLGSLDMVREEEKPVFGVGGESQALVYDFQSEEYVFEPERFSADLDWMPNLVLIAKNSYVWLDQLSKKYERPIKTLDQIPGEELDQLARWGISGLWLIGLWERSPASQRIKQMRGNPEAVASAYSLFGYEIAEDLGGEPAYQSLRDRAWRRGIRLASDMVPNHMGIDSRWVIEHPDWFLSLDYSPFPTYTFNGPNLSWDERVGIYLEDHYYNNSDAAVVFKRVDFWTGSEKYIYHGNDGTSMPWNDTAQLNYLLPEVREAAIQTILHVARKFPVIRFDAAMTLAKKHIHRLWFPEPGSGGDIPSRAEHGMTKAQFDQVFPEEFWRQVVDRVAQEVPDTLLLAEAFWMMEGYFVRTLGMHRVYNSAFMNMLRDEKNNEYRLVIKNTLEFDPEILKRYVNFMNNPDERTAVDQFGKGDKYFGVCMMMATMPGLPMLGHGQIEGYTEKYGMEYKRAYWDEIPDDYLVERHRREIFPLLRRRWMFAEVSNFLLYDFYTPEGFVNEDVFAYSNQSGNERSLVVYHNRYAETQGWIHQSAAFAVKTGQGDEKILMQKTLGQALGASDDGRYYMIFRDLISGLEFIRNNQELSQRGLELRLPAYKFYVFMNFRLVQDDEYGNYGQVAARLNGQGTSSVDDELKEMLLAQVLNPYRELVNPGMLDWLIQNRVEAETFQPVNYNMALQETQQKVTALLLAVNEQVAPGTVAGEVDVEALTSQVVREIKVLLNISAFGKNWRGKELQPALEYLLAGPGKAAPLAIGQPGQWGAFLAYLVTTHLGQMRSAAQAAQQSRAWLDEWLLGKIIRTALSGLGVEAIAAQRYSDLLSVLVACQDWFQPKETPEKMAADLLQAWVDEPAAQRFIMTHLYGGVQWFNKEAFDDLVWWTFAAQVVNGAAGIELAGKKPDQVKKLLQTTFQVVDYLIQRRDASAYRLDRLAKSGDLQEA